MIRKNFTHNENIKTFDDVSCHLEIETERLEVMKPKHSSYMVESGPCKVFRHKHNTKIGVATRHLQKEPRPSKCGKRGKCETQNSKLDCFNCGKKGQFACDCTEPKKVPHDYSLFIYVTSHIMLLTHSPCGLLIQEQPST